MDRAALSINVSTEETAICVSSFPNSGCQSIKAAQVKEDNFMN